MGSNASCGLSNPGEIDRHIGRGFDIEGAAGAAPELNLFGQ